MVWMDPTEWSLTDEDRRKMDNFRHLSVMSQIAEKAGVPVWKAHMYWLEQCLEEEQQKVAAFTDGKIYLVVAGQAEEEIVVLTKAQAEWWMEVLTAQAKRAGKELTYRIVTRSVGFCRSADLSLMRSGR